MRADASSRGAEGRDEAILALAPLLLLLTQDPMLCPYLTTRRRYFPPLVATLLYLSASSVSAIAATAADGALATVVAVLAFLCPLPSLLCLSVFLWNRKKQSEWLLLFFTPLNILPAVFAAEPSSQLLAGGAIVGAVVQGVATRRTRSAATKLI